MPSVVVVVKIPQTGCDTNLIMGGKIISATVPAGHTEAFEYAYILLRQVTKIENSERRHERVLPPYLNELELFQKYFTHLVGEIQT